MPRQLFLDSMDHLVTAEVDRHTGMIALVPSEEDAMRLAIPGYESPDALHVTMLFLGEQDEEDAQMYREAGGLLAERLGGPVVGNVWARCGFNPIGTEPCITYLVGGAALDEAHKATEYVMGDGAPEQHLPWVPHITIAYTTMLSPMTLTKFGPITFDRVRVAFGDDDVTDYPLG